MGIFFFFRQAPNTARKQDAHWVNKMCLVVTVVTIVAGNVTIDLPISLIESLTGHKSV